MKNTPIQMKTQTITPAALGSISHGTLRPQDLLSSFLSELEWQLQRNRNYFAQPENRDERDKLNGLIGEAQDCFTDDGQDIRDESYDVAEEMVNERFPDALQTFCKPYCYFGAHGGDGSDFGYWPSHDQIEELPQISDNSAEAIAAEQSDDCLTDVYYVNDHGNVTVYGADGSVILELV
jgi:hypothetical protein